MVTYRDFLLYGVIPSPVSLVLLMVTGAGICVVGTAVFKRLERRFAEVI